ncbi:Signal recognition particle subunit SRP68 [Entamoeba marina]
MAETVKHFEKKKIKLDKGINLKVFDTIFQWRQTNGLKHDDFTRYRRFCTRRLKRLRQKVHLQNNWEKKKYQHLVLTPEMMKTAECVTIPLLLVERCWASANELAPVDDDDTRKKHHQRRRLKKSLIYITNLFNLAKTCNKRTQRELVAYMAYMKGMIAFNKENYQVAIEEYLTALQIIDAISKEFSEDAKIVYRDFIDDANAKVRYCKNEGSEDPVINIDKWLSVEGEAQLFCIPDDQMREVMKYYRESLNKSVNERRALIQRAVVHCNKKIADKKCQDRMLYKELLDYARDQKAALDVEEALLEINELEKELGEYSLNQESNKVTSNTKHSRTDVVMLQYSKLIFMENKKLQPKQWLLNSWKAYKMYYHALSLFNNNKNKDAYAILRQLNDTIDDLLPSVDMTERPRLEYATNIIHKLAVEILKRLWLNKAGENGAMNNTCIDLVQYPSLEKKSWFSWW